MLQKTNSHTFREYVGTFKLTHSYYALGQLIIAAILLCPQTLYRVYRGCFNGL